MNTILILAIAILLIISIVILIKNKKSKKEPIDVVPDNTTTTTLSPPTTTVSTKTWWATGNSGSCGDPCGQQVYTALGFTYLNVSYFYNTSDLTPDDYYAPGSGTIGFTDQSYGNAIYTANIAIDGSMSSNDACLTTTTTTLIETNGKKYWMFSRCVDSSEFWMEDSIKNKYESSLGKFQTGDRFYGAVEGDRNYLYTYVPKSKVFDSLPQFELRGVSRTDDRC
mgnify:CR=1 FL=1